MQLVHNEMPLVSLLFMPDHPAYYTLFADGDRFRMVYRGAHFDAKTKKSAHPEFACYAESQDGIQWVKPKLGIVEFQGSKDNNIILAGEGTHNFTPFLDTNPACLPDAKYKALAGDAKGLKAYKRWQQELIPITAPKNRDGNRSNYMANGLLQNADLYSMRFEK